MRIFRNKVKSKNKKGDLISGIVPIENEWEQWRFNKYNQKEKITFRKSSFRKHKSLPKGCKMPKRICIVCLKMPIHKNDSNYESKVCKRCTALELAR